MAGFAKEKAKSITIANRTMRKANNLAEFSKINLDANAITIEQVGESAKDYNIIVNATSVGLQNESSQYHLKELMKKQ